ncbi:MAG: Na/Pi cotransporter family protein [Bacteroidales bacterium]|nr:Na/Pi cotransporter family protein [Bacteroidales bacterium]MBR1894297.1 Na/Pi cotransporter family protein [Bacteroidales bacterium]
MILQILTLFGALGLLLYGMGILTAGAQKSTGPLLRRYPDLMARSTAKQVAFGIGYTSLLQSSSATTIIAVGFVNAGMLTLVQSIGVIMGANIGTTVTAWLFTIFGFHLEATWFTFPILLAGFLMTMLKNPKIKNIGEYVLGFAIMFIGLFFLRSAFPADSPALDGLFDKLSGFGFWSVLIYFIISILLTVCLQSSAVTMAFTLMLTYSGLISFEMAAAMVLGENLGTTLTANIAARKADVQARRAALTHILFNLIGVVIILTVFPLCLKGVKAIIDLFPIANPALADLYAIALFHTLFNLLTTLLLLPFREKLAALVVRMIAEPEKKDEPFRLRHISTWRIASPAIAIEQTYREVLDFAQAAFDGFQYVKRMLTVTDADKFELYRTKLIHCEEITDKYEYELAAFLSKLSAENTSSEENQEIKSLYRVISELESLGDSCENISRLFVRLRTHTKGFNEESSSKLALLIGKVNQAFVAMITNLKAAQQGTLTSIDNAITIEQGINETRDVLREEGILQIERQSGNYQSMNYYLDMLEQLEAMGDFIINVSQSILKVKEQDV